MKRLIYSVLAAGLSITTPALACPFKTDPDTALRTFGPPLHKAIETCAASGLNFSKPVKNGKIPFREIVAISNDPKAVELMLQAGADPNTRSKHGAPAFVDAVNFAYDRDDKAFLKMMELLGEAGADFSQPDNNGQLALSMATGSDAVKLMEVLLRHGADPNGLNAYNRTPLFASVFGTCNVKGGDILIAAGATLAPMPGDQVERMFKEAQKNCANSGKGRRYINRLQGLPQ